MRPSLRVVSALALYSFLVSFLSPAVAAPLYPVEILLKNGDAIPGVGLVTTIDNLAVSDSGSWIVQVDTDNPDTTVDSCLVKDGAVLLRDAAVIVLCVVILKEIYHPERDKVRMSGDDPLAGVLEDAPDRRIVTPARGEPSHRMRTRSDAGDHRSRTPDAV